MFADFCLEVVELHLVNEVLIVLFVSVTVVSLIPSHCCKLTLIYKCPNFTYVHIYVSKEYQKLVHVLHYCFTAMSLPSCKLSKRTNIFTENTLQVAYYQV